MYFVFLDLKRAFDPVPRDVVCWALRKLGIEEWLIKIVQSRYRNARSRARISETFIDDFLVQIGLHHGPKLSPLLFTIKLKALSDENRSECPEVLLYADDLAIINGQ